MRVLAPPVKLALCRVTDGEPRRGSITRSFSSGYELYHGNRILHGVDADYDPEQKFKQKMHTVQAARTDRIERSPATGLRADVVS